MKKVLLTLDTAKLNIPYKLLLDQILARNPDCYTRSTAGKVGSVLLENRLREVISEPAPSTPNYDFCYGKGRFFSNCKVELKQASGNTSLFFQVKPALYDKILMVKEEKLASYWFVMKTSDISSKVGRKNKEKGKLLLSKQHEGNPTEGQIGMDIATRKFMSGESDTILKKGKDQFSDIATFIGKFNPILYDKKDLNIEDADLLSILSFVKSF